MSATYTTTTGNVVTLREKRYLRAPAPIPDDTIIDPVAIERAVTGEAPHPRLTHREIVCVVAELNAAGLADAKIADRLGRSRAWVETIRGRHGIPRPELNYSDRVSWQIITDTSKRSRTSERRRKAAGMVA